VLIYALMISVVYQIMYWKNVMQRHIQSIINVISLTIFQFIVASTFNEITEVLIVGLVTTAFIFIFFIKYMFIDLSSYKEKEDIYTTAVNTSLYLLSIYMSILVIGTYFKTISLIVMYVLTTLWTILNIFFKKDKTDWLFFAIGNISYFVSIRSSKELTINDKSFIIPVLIYALMISVVYQIMYWKNVMQRHIQSIINVISLTIFQFIVASTFRKTTEYIVVIITTIVFALIGSIEYTMFDFFIYRKEHFYIALVNIAVYFLSYIRLNNAIKFYLPAILTFIVTITPSVLLEMINMHWKSKNLAEGNKPIVNAVLSTILFYVASLMMGEGGRSHFLYSSGIILVLYSSIMIYGIIKKNSFFKNQAWILLSLCMYSEIELFVDDHTVYVVNGNNLLFTVVATVLLLLFLIVEGFILNDSETYKMISYFAVLSWILRVGYYAYNYYGYRISSKYKPYVIDKDYITVITYGIMALLNMIMILTKFYKTKEKEEISNLFDMLSNHEKKNSIRILLDALNLIFMLFGVKMMYVFNDRSNSNSSSSSSSSSSSNSHINIQLQLIYMVIVIILAFINLPVKNGACRERYIYTAVKFSFLIYYSLWIHQIENYVISISMIAFAVVCIAIGFWNRLIGKELRIYGLVMTIIFVIKLIIIDISYDSSVLKASSYLISGGLCFGISAIYNYFEDNNSNNNNNNKNNNDKNDNDKKNN